MSTKLMDSILKKQFKSAFDFCNENLKNSKDPAFWMATSIEINKLKRQFELEKEVDRDYKYSGVVKIK